MTDTTTAPGVGALFHDPGAWSDMDAWHARVAELRRADPVILVDDPGFEPFHVLTRHADVLAVSRDNTTWHNTAQSVLGPAAAWQEMRASEMPLPASLVHLDGHEHRAHRAVTNDWFKPATVRHRQPRIDELADLFVEGMRELGGRCDFARDIAQPYTLRVIMDIYGVPEEDEPLMMDLTQGIFGAGDPEFLGDATDPNQRVMAAVMRFITYFNEITEDRRACPADDLASVIANGQVDGAPMGDVERLWYYIIVATAGHDTTSFALAGGMEQLARRPDELFGLVGDDAAVVDAAAEILRWTSPVRHFLRYATEPTSVAGVDIPEGGRLLLSYPSANRDEEVFADPMVFDIRREGADRHVGFGGGAHFCLGAQFARRELRTMLHRLSRELTHVELDGDPEWSRAHFVSGVKGEFEWSSQHLDMGVVRRHVQARAPAGGAGDAGEDLVAGSAVDRASGAPGRVLGGDRLRVDERGRGRRGGHVIRVRGPVVPGGWRYATSQAGGGVGPLPVTRRARGDRDPARAETRGSRDCPADRAVTVDDLPGAAPERVDPHRGAGVPGDHGAVARRAASKPTEGSQARRERPAARVRRGPPRWQDQATRRHPRARP
jgi:cytochrome P450